MTQTKDYHSRLRSVIANAAEDGPADVRLFDWDKAGQIRSGCTRAFLARTVNRLYQGELVTAAACEALAERVDDPVVRDCLLHQVADEHRHAEIYLRYMRALGVEPHADPVAEEIGSAVAVWRGHPSAIVAGLNVALEGAAMEIQLKLAKDAACPVFRDINRRIARDEARHLAFGRIYLTEVTPHLDERDRKWIIAWLRGVWQRASEHAFQGLPGTKVLPMMVRRQILKRGWRRTENSLRTVGLAA